MVTVGIIGAGRIGKVHANSICNLVKNARVKTIADPFMNEATEKWAKELGIPQDRTYVRYSAHENWGWNGSNF